jgi:hypothetical protein
VSGVRACTRVREEGKRRRGLFFEGQPCISSDFLPTDERAAVRRSLRSPVTGAGETSLPRAAASVHVWLLMLHAASMRAWLRDGKRKVGTPAKGNERGGQLSRSPSRDPLALVARWHAGGVPADGRTARVTASSSLHLFIDVDR